MRGPGSFRLAGEIADGVHVACAHSDEALRFAAEMVREGAARVDRTLDNDFDFCASILGAISLDGEAAREGARVAAAFYISSMPPELIERHGIPFAEVVPVVEAFGRGDVDTRADARTGERRRAAVTRGNAAGVDRADQARLSPARLQPPRTRTRGPVPRRTLVRSARRRATPAARAAPTPPRPRPSRLQLTPLRGSTAT